MSLQIKSAEDKDHTRLVHTKLLTSDWTLLCSVNVNYCS